MSVSRGVILVSTLALILAGCGRGGDDVTLTRIKNTGNGPDEFTVLPTKPLEQPENFSALPAPTPGGTNRVDTNPEAEGIAALGGNPNAVIPAGVGAADGALLNRARRNGVDPDIRPTLAQEDRDTRRRHGRVNIFNIGPNDDYTNAYKKQWLDGYDETERLRRRGVMTPSAPPPT